MTNIKGNNLTAAEAERLAMLLEELGEAQFFIGKILRHGYDTQAPKGLLSGRSNREWLAKEFGDIIAVMGWMRHMNDVTSWMVSEAKEDKRNRMHRFLHHNDGPKENE